MNSAKLLRAIRSGLWIKVTTGAYARRAEWEKLKPIERHRVRTFEVLRRLRRPATISHFAAASIHGIDILGTWPDAVDVTCPPASGGRSGGAVRRHGTMDATLETLPLFAEHRLTTPAQTALDLARLLPFVRGVTAVDQAIHSAREGGSLTTLDELTRLTARSQAHRGDVRAARVLAFADPLAANVRESQARVVFMQLGFPRPCLQHKRVLRSGRVAYSDLYFAEHDHWVEIDGRGKYVNPEFGADRSAQEIVIDEKNRENEIRREVRGFSRLEATELDRPRLIYDVLTGDGLPSILPRP